MEHVPGKFAMAPVTLWRIRGFHITNEASTKFTGKLTMPELYSPRLKRIDLLVFCHKTSVVQEQSVPSSAQVRNMPS